MERQLACSSSKSPEKQKNPEKSIGNSTYVVNNSLFCSIQPKRASIDLKLYLQLHKKLSRRALIEKKFEESIYQLRETGSNSRKGFLGKLKPQGFLTRTISSRDREKRLYASGKVLTAESQESNMEVKWPCGQEEIQDKTLVKTGLHSQHTKPNMMYNLSLYRKGFKRQDFKNQKMTNTIMNNMQRTRRVMTKEYGRQILTTYSNKLLTAS